MKKLLFLLMLSLPLISQAQDVITMQSGEKIKGKVTAISNLGVIYIPEGSTDNKTKMLNKNDVVTITYESGKVMNYYGAGRNRAAAMDGKAAYKVNEEVNFNYRREIKRGIITALGDKDATISSGGKDYTITYDNISKPK